MAKKDVKKLTKSSDDVSVESLSGKDSEKKRDDLLNNPINRFISSVDDDGNVKYPISVKIKNYYLYQFDVFFDNLRKSLVYLQELRWRKSQSVKYLKAYNDGNVNGLRDKYGMVMTVDDCYLTHLTHDVNVYSTLKDLRDHLLSRVLVMVDGKDFTFDDFNNFVCKIDTIVSKEGYELFPERLVIPEPK